MTTSYWPAIVLSLVLHGLVILLVFKGWSHEPAQRPFKPPSFIKATLVEVKPQTTAPQKATLPKKEPKKNDSNKQRQEDARLKKLAKEKQAQEKLRKQQLAKQKAAEAKAKKAREKKAREQKQAEQRKQQQALEKQLFEQSLAQEQAMIEAEQQAEAQAQQLARDALLAQSYSQLIRQRVEQHWSRPLSLVRQNLEALLSIQLIPTGEVIHVAIKKSSGNAVFDRSAIQAVKKARQFPELKELPSRVFEREFRQLTLQFKP